MTTTVLDKEIVMESDDDIGGLYLFVVPGAPEHQVFRFSSRLEEIGLNWDRTLKNKTKVMVISGPEKIKHPTNGTMSVTKVMELQSMWVQTGQLVKIR